jgi:hypothetical protein
VKTQPAQSPDLTLNDLGFFRSLKCRSDELRDKCKTLDELMAAVEKAWEEYPADTLERIWGHQFECYRRILAYEGSKDYVGPHSGVRLRQNNGYEAIDLRCDVELIKSSKNLYTAYF